MLKNVSTSLVYIHASISLTCGKYTTVSSLQAPLSQPRLSSVALLVNECFLQEFKYCTDPIKASLEGCSCDHVFSPHKSLWAVSYCLQNKCKTFDTLWTLLQGCSTSFYFSSRTPYSFLQFPKYRQLFPLLLFRNGGSVLPPSLSHLPWTPSHGCWGTVLHRGLPFLHVWPGRSWLPLFGTVLSRAFV